MRYSVVIMMTGARWMGLDPQFPPLNCIPRDKEEPRKRAGSPEVRLFPSGYDAELAARWCFGLERNEEMAIG